MCIRAQPIIRCIFEKDSIYIVTKTRIDILTSARENDTSVSFAPYGTYLYKTHLYKNTSTILGHIHTINLFSHDTPRGQIFVQPGFSFPYVQRLSNFPIRMVLSFLQNPNLQWRVSQLFCLGHPRVTLRKMVTDRGELCFVGSTPQMLIVPKAQWPFRLADILSST